MEACKLFSESDVFTLAKASLIPPEKVVFILELAVDRVYLKKIGPLGVQVEELQAKLTRLEEAVESYLEPLHSHYGDRFALVQALAELRKA